jgi:hypothetical protein
MGPLFTGSPDNIVEWTIRTLVRDRCSPELEELYVRLNAALEQAGCRMHFDALDNLLATLNDLNISPEEVVPGVDEELRVAAERSLNICGVELQSEVSLVMLCEAVDVICNFDPTDTPSLLIDVLNSAEDADSAFALLMSYQGTFEETDWIAEILEISPNFTSTVLRSLKETADADETVEIDPAHGQELLKRLSRLVRTNGETIGAELGKNNTGMGVSTESLYGVHVGNIIHKPIAAAVEDVFSLSVISNERYEVAMESVSRCIDDLFYEPEQRREAEQVRIRLSETYKPIFGGADA